jgi:hypothetical protein
MYSFLTSCVSVANGDDINEMAAIATDINAEEFLEIANDYGFKEIMLEDLGYNDWADKVVGEAENLFINDFGINMAESRFQGIPALYVRHSGIEHIYIPNNEFNKYRSDEESSDERRDFIDDISDKYDDLFHNGLKNKNLFNDLNAFINDNKEQLIEFNTPLTTLAYELSNYDEKFISILREKEQEYLTELLTLKTNVIEEVLNNKINDLKIDNSKNKKPTL